MTSNISKPHYTLLGSKSVIAGEPAPLTIAGDSPVVGDVISFSDSGSGGRFDPEVVTVTAPMLAQFAYTNDSPGDYSITVTSAAGGLVWGSPFSLRVAERKPPALPRPPDPIPTGAMGALLALRRRYGSLGPI